MPLARPLVALLASLVLTSPRTVRALPSVEVPRIARVTGTVHDAEGRVVPNCRVVVLHPAFDPLKEVRCDAAGRYELSLDVGSYNAIAILDDGYGKTTLEFWAWNVRVSGDLVLDATIGTLEVYDLSLWNAKGGPPALFLSFRPMSLERALAKGRPRPRVVDGDTLLVQDVSPTLSRQQLDVTVDGVRVDVQSLQWYYDRYADSATGTTQHLAMSLLQLTRPKLAKGIHVVRVRITDAITHAIGEGVTFFESNEAGFGF